jgi:hypothetical protein
MVCDRVIVPACTRRVKGKHPAEAPAGRVHALLASRFIHLQFFTHFPTQRPIAKSFIEEDRSLVKFIDIQLDRCCTFSNCPILYFVHKYASYSLILES